MAGRSPALGDLPICIDARMLGGQGTGVATYANSLHRAVATLTTRPMVLAASHGDDGRVRQALGALRRVEHRIVERGNSITGRDLFRRAHIHFSLFGRPLRIVAPGKPGIMHWTYPLPIVLDGWANLYTVHDAIPLTHPELTSIDPVRHRAVLTALAGEAAAFVTVSNDARREIIAAMRLPDSLVVNAGQAIDATVPPPAALPAGLQPGGYFLFCGAIDTRKNLSRLIVAHERSGSGLPLVIVGPDGDGGAAIDRQMAASAHVVRLNFQDRDTLRRLIQQARALLFPSLAEGFGLPVIEAMALGTPVMTSSGGALEEVAGGAALLVEATDSDALADAIRRLAADDALVQRLVEAGHRRAQDFTPALFARRLAAIYREIRT